MNDHDLISALRASGRQSMPLASRDRIRQTLLQEFQRVTVSPPERFKTSKGLFYHLSFRPMIVTAIIAIVLAAGVGTTAVADAAKPGDFLFGWDQASERLRGALTFSESAKATYQSRVAEERLRERLELEAENSEFAEEARERAERALEQALETVGRVRLKLEAKNNGEGAAALERVELRLRSMHAGGDASDDEFGEIKAEIEGARTKIKVEVGLNRWEFSIDGTTVDEIVAAIVSRTGLAEADVRAVLRIERSDDDDVNGNTNSSDDKNDDADDDSDNDGSDDSDDSSDNADDSDDDSNSNRSQDDDSDDDSDDDRPANTNQNRNSNTNSNDDSDDDVSGQVEIRVEVNLEDAKTEIRTKVNGQEQEWELATTSQAQILASISAKTGLTNSQITSVWDYEVE